MIKYYLIIIVLSVGLFSCGDDPEVSVVFDDTPYPLEVGNFPPPNLPSDNALTVQGVKLGRMLFYEPKLSNGDSQACASCHNQANGFSDISQFSLGVQNLPGNRQAMGVFNMAWNSNAFGWDGRAPLIRDQSLLPIQDALEMDETLENVMSKLSAETEYKEQFIRAFGDEAITAERMSLAMEQFMLSIVSVHSKYDEFQAGNVMLSESEERGRKLFFTEYNPFFPDESGADCEHCHGGINFENDRYMNNGLDTDADITDLGREIVTGNITDRAKFKVPSLRNIALTPPYMHDGRFETLEEVLDHYDHGMKSSLSIDPALVQVIDGGGLQLEDQDKIDLINFLKTLTDNTFVNNQEYSDPF